MHVCKRVQSAHMNETNPAKERVTCKSGRNKGKRGEIVKTYGNRCDVKFDDATCAVNSLRSKYLSTK